MKRILKLLLLLVGALSIAVLIWVNTGSRSESGYAYCGGEGFISKKELAQMFGPGVNPGVPCLGPTVTKKIPGRYANINTSMVNLDLAVIATFSLIGYIYLQFKRNSKK